MCLTLHHVSSLQSASIWYSDDIYNGRMPILYKMSYYYRFISREVAGSVLVQRCNKIYRSVLADPFSDLQGRATIGQPSDRIMII